MARSADAPRCAGSTRRPRPSHALALAAALFLPGTAALAAGGITFTNMTVERCGEMGACEWRLSCWLGKQAPSELIPSAEGATQAAIDIGKSYSVDRFPATVSCTAWEDDGWPGTSWDPVATGTLPVPSGGDFALELKNADEGTVRVHLIADSLEVVGAPPAAGSPRRFLGVFRPTEDGHAVILGLSWQQLEERAKALAGRGVHLYDLETYRDGKERRWSGIFRSGPDEQILLGGLEWEPFSARYQELEGKGMRLVDLETYDDGKKRLFAGVFHSGTDSMALWVGQEKTAFQNKWTELTGQGLRLTDLEVYRADRKVYYAGLFREGSGGRGYWADLDWNTFVEKAKTSSADGMHPIDLETFEDGNKRLYAASLKGGGTAVQVEPPQEAAVFTAKWNELRGKGTRLIDLEVFPE